MDINKRVQDLSQVFDRNYQVNNNNQGRRDFLDSRKEHFKKMYNIRDRQDFRNDILKSNSVNGQVENLNNRIGAMNDANRMSRMNDFKRNFR